MDEDEDVFVQATPYCWPYDGSFSPESTALLIIDMQIDFCGKGGYVDLMGYDLSLTACAIEPIQRLLEKVRTIPGFTSFIPAKAIGQIYRICRQINVGEAPVLGLRLVQQVRWGESSFAMKQAGILSRH